ncbi:MAG: spiro-SPASM protein, partial [Leptospiraceae bacterium]|nr:spiro-SPASM protein [Leptospiraceae bacterium]
KNKKEKKEISPDIYKKAIREFEETFQFPLTVCLGGLGEPLLHSSFLEFIDVALDYTYLEKIYIETALYPNIDKLLDYLGKLDESEKAKVQFIINISTLDLEKYKSLYNPKDIGLEEILKKIDKLISVLGKDSVYVQMIKMKEIESEIESYFNTWEEKGVKIILQKYNSFAKKLPERRVSDLTPIQRDFCWHLARDLYLNYDGKVSICKQDIKKELGDLNKESILEIWNRGKENFQNSFSGKHDLLPSPCLDCDEWYTFNA